MSQSLKREQNREAGVLSSGTGSLRETADTFSATSNRETHAGTQIRAVARRRSAAKGSTTVADSTATQSWTVQLPTLLRGFGAAAVVFSLYSFLFRGWEGSSDVIRYTMLLGHTVLLAVIALTSGHFFREGKGPRLLMSLALVSVPVNFAILGAFIFSVTSGANLARYPDYVAWTAASLNSALAATVAGTVLLLPVILLGFRTLARGMSGRMSTLFMLGNMALLIPLREPVWVAGMGFVLGVCTLMISANTARQRTEVKTREGMIALLLQFLPVGVLLGRSIWLYSADAFLFTAISATGFVALRHCTQNMPQARFRTVLEFLSLVMAANTGLQGLIAMTGTGVNDTIAILGAGVVAAALSYELASRANSLNEFYRICAVGLLTSSVLLNLLVSGGAIASLTTLSVGGALLVFSYFERKRSLLAGGLLLLFVGLADQFVHLFQLFDFGYWVGLASIGVVAIVTASVLEVRGESLRLSLRRYRKQYVEWSY